MFGVFHPYFVPKLLSYIIVAVTFYLLYRLIIRITNGDLLSVFSVLILLAINTSFVVWSCSGLENSLYAFLVVWLIVRLADYIETPNIPTTQLFLMAIITAAIAATRPDGPPPTMATSVSRFLSNLS